MAERIRTDAVYLYCFGRADCFAALPLPSPDRGPPLLLQPAGELVAVLAEVARSEFCGAAAEQRLADPNWVAGAVARHAAIVEWAMQRSPVFPARFGTLFSSPRRVAALMRRQAAQIGRMLDRVEGAAEWAVKVWLDRPAATRWRAAALAAQAPAAGQLSAGAGYLRDRQLQTQAGKGLEAWLQPTLRALSARLLQHAVELRCRPHPPAAAELAANWALLVADSQASAFGERLAAINPEFAEQGLRIELSGPWPPYSFCVSLSGE